MQTFFYQTVTIKRTDQRFGKHMEEIYSSDIFASCVLVLSEDLRLAIAEHGFGGCECGRVGEGVGWVSLQIVSRLFLLHVACHTPYFCFSG